MTRIFLIIACCAASVAKGQDLKQVMENYFNKLGGVDAISQAKSSKEISLNWYNGSGHDRPDLSSFIKTMTLLRESKLKKFVSFDSKGAIENEFYYNEKGTVLGMGNFIQHLEKNDIPATSMGLEILDLYNAGKLESDGEKRFNNVDYNVVKTKNTEDIRYFYFNKTTGLLDRSQIFGSERFTEYKNYKQTNLLLHPFFIEEYVGNVMYFQQLIQSVEFNPVIDSKVFYFDEATYYNDIAPKEKFQSAKIESDASDLITFIRTNFINERILIDMWATWCSPCLKEFRNYDSAFYTFMENHRIKIVYLSIDKDSDKRKWENEIDRLGLSGVHVRANQKLLNSIRNIVFRGQPIAVPRYVLVNEHNSVVSYDFLKPSSVNFRHSVDSIFQNVPSLK